MVCRVQTQAHAKLRAAEILAASAAIPRLKKEIEALQQEVLSLDAKQNAALSKASQRMRERGKVPLFAIICTLQSVCESFALTGVHFEQVYLAAKHMFQHCLEHTKVAHKSHARISDQLRIIGNFVSDYDSLLQRQGLL